MQIRPEDCTREELICYARMGCMSDDWEFQRIILACRCKAAERKRKMEHRAASGALRRCQKLMRPFHDSGADIPSEVFRSAMTEMQSYHRHTEEELRYRQREDAYRAELEALYDWR